MNKDTLIEKISKGIMQVSISKNNIDMEVLVKKIGFKIKNIKNKKNIKGVLGNEGKVFDSIVAVSKGLNKIIVLYKKKKNAPFFLLLDTTKNKDFEKEIEAVNNNEKKELKNKSLQLNYILETAINFLENKTLN